MKAGDVQVTNPDQNAVIQPDFRLVVHRLQTGCTPPSELQNK